MVCPQRSAGLRVDRFEPAVHARRSKPDRGRERVAPHLLQVVLLRLQASRALPKFESYEDARPQTLYAYVSRGLIRARPDERDSRRSRYSIYDVQGLVTRKKRARRRRRNDRSR